MLVETKRRTIFTPFVLPSYCDDAAMILHLSDNKKRCSPAEDTYQK